MLSRFLFLITLCLANTCCAQQALYRHINTSKGLAGNVVYHIFQDADHNIWYATETGVTRFNGSNYQSFNKQDGLADNSILTIFQDRVNRIWFLSSNGKPSYYSNGVFKSPTNDSSLAKIDPSCFLSYFYKDKKGNVWLGSNCKGLYQMDSSGNVTNYISGKFQTRIYHIQEFKDKIYVLSRDGIQIVNNNKLEPVSKLKRNFSSLRSVFHEGKYYVYEAGTISAINLDGHIEWQLPLPTNQEILYLGRKSKTELWIGTRNGYLEFDIPTKKMGNTHLKNEAISSVIEDHEGGVWVSTLDHGVFYTPNIAIKNYSIDEGLPDNAVSELLKINEDQLILGYDNATFVEISNQRLTTTRLKKGNSRNRIRFIGKHKEDLFLSLEANIVKISKNPNDTVYYQMASRDLYFESEYLIVCNGLGVTYLPWGEISKFEYRKGVPQDLQNRLRKLVKSSMRL